MGMWSTVRGVGAAFGFLEPTYLPIACSLGRNVYRETKRAAQIANIRRPAQRMQPATERLMAHLFPELDVERIRYRSGCRLPPNRFKADGNILAMTFGYSIYWRGELDEHEPRDIVNLIHEVLHVDQVRRFGGEHEFACAYGKGYVEGGGHLPPTSPARLPTTATRWRRRPTRSRPASRTPRASPSPASSMAAGLTPTASPGR